MSQVTYLTMDSVVEGVGASQVWPYVSRLAQDGHSIRVVSFEKEAREPTEIPRGLDWAPRTFGHGRLAPFRRIGLAASEARAARSGVVHARSDLPALAAMLAGHPRWIWDVRSFWREQRIQLGGIAPGSPTDRVLQRVEGAAAQRSAAIICLAEAAAQSLVARFGSSVRDKVTVIPTAVDTSVFTPTEPSRSSPLRVLLSGSYNLFYDGQAMADLIRALRRRTAVRATWVGADERSPWWAALKPVLDYPHGPVPFAEVPNHIRANDVGLAVCRNDAGPSLRAAMPTKIAEFLACGRPVVVNSGLGDMDALIERYRCGVVIHDPSPVGIAAAAEHLLDLLGDDEVTARARTCAVEAFDLEASVARLGQLYEHVADRS